LFGFPIIPTLLFYHSQSPNNNGTANNVMPAIKI
jgi:hypothetical protein